MRVGFNARILSNSNLRGWNRYAINLIAGLADLGVELYLYTDRELDPAQLSKVSIPRVTIRKASAMNYVRWEQVWLPSQCAKDKINVFHSPFHFGLPLFTKAKCVLTLHDAIDEIYYAPKLRRKSFNQLRSGLMCAVSRFRADHIVTVSEHSKADLIRHFHLPPDKISMIYEAADDRFEKTPEIRDTERARVKYRLPSKFVFYVGSLEQRKNLPFLLRSLAETKLSTLNVVIAGGGTHQENRALQEVARSLQIQERVFLIGRVDDQDLPAIYAQAEAFVYPSEYEGFGLQICEAMSTGCPVFTSDASCFPEILADGGEVFPILGVETLSGYLKRNHLDSAFRESMKTRAKKRSLCFSWEKTARETCLLYEWLCASPFAEQRSLNMAINRH